MGKRKSNGKRSGKSAPFLKLPHHVIGSPPFNGLSGWGVKLLVHVAGQYNGHNNGDLCAVWSKLKDMGWHSKGTLNDAIKELECAGFIERTRQGGKHKPNLFAITWEPIDECNGKLEVQASVIASNRWRFAQPNELQN